MGEPAGKSNAELYPRSSSHLGVVAIIVALVVAGLIVLLVTGGADIPEEARGDLTYIEGEVPQRQRAQGPELVASIADVTQAEVRADGDELLFEAQLAAPLPQPLKTSALELRWDVRAEGSTWTLSVTIDKDAQAAVFSDTGYGSGTVDQTLPGSLEIGKQSVLVRLRPGDIEAFPSEFEWSLATTLRAFRNAVDSPRVEDRFPDQGSNPFDH